MPRMRRRDVLSEHPARFVVAVFVLAILAGTLLLLLPFSSADGGSTTVIEAAFTATSAVCVTGLVVVDTGTHWSGFGQGVILALIELGGIGFMTIASLILLAVSRRLGLRQTMVTKTERGALALGDVRKVLVRLAVITVSVQTVVALWLAIRLVGSYGESFSSALWSGAFHSISAFNNAGFSLYSDSLTIVRSDPGVMLAIMGAIIVGGLGFPVLADLDSRFLRRGNTQRRSIAQRWDGLTLHSKVTLTTTAALLVLGAVVLGALEWANPATMGHMDTGEKVLNSTFASVTPRTAGFNTVPVGDMEPASLLVTTVLMFIGAGSAGTSGGIKVGTFAILAMVIWSELRGEREPTGFRRTIPTSTQRQAVTVALLAVALVVGGATALLMSSDTELGEALFETVSAFGTVGLSTGVTPSLHAWDDLVLMALMLIGRVGPITLGAALVLRRRPTVSRVPEEAPLIG
ncbi:MAG: TrkH family potassium uptake protein [Microthrixaceae bacterium]|nr:TrkH family potassium uptake protein [Microthrixaceae bacterium]